MDKSDVMNSTLFDAQLLQRVRDQMKPAQVMPNRMELKLVAGNVVAAFEGLIGGTEVAGSLGENRPLISMVKVETNTMQIQSRAIDPDCCKRMGWIRMLVADDPTWPRPDGM